MGQWLGRHHGECGARTYNGGLRAEPPAGSRGRAPGQEVRGGEAPEAESILVIGCPTEPANLAPVREKQYALLRPTGVRVGGQSAWCPQPCHWGAVPPGPPAPPPMHATWNHTVLPATRQR